MSVIIRAIIPNQIPKWCDIFNHPDFFKLNRDKNSYYFSLFFDEKLIGLCHFTEIGLGYYRSPLRGTYGSISFKENLSLELKSNSVKKVISFLENLGVKKVEIVSRPFSHHVHDESSLLNIYLNQGFVISSHEINHSIKVDHNPFFEKMMRNNKKRFNKCKRANFVFEMVHSICEIGEVYQIIKENREGNGYKISMTIDQILKMYDTFNDSIYFFKTTYNGQCIASSMCIKLNNNVLYVFYWGDKQGYEQFSPVVFLANGIYDFAYQNKFKLIDVGTSSLKGRINFGLATFKQNLGFTISPKLTYQKIYE